MNDRPESVREQAAYYLKKGRDATLEERIIAGRLERYAELLEQHQSLKARFDRAESELKSVQRWGCPEYGPSAYRDPQGEYVLIDDIKNILAGGRL